MRTHSAIEDLAPLDPYDHAWWGTNVEEPDAATVGAFAAEAARQPHRTR